MVLFRDDKKWDDYEKLLSDVYSNPEKWKSNEITIDIYECNKESIFANIEESPSLFHCSC